MHQVSTSQNWYRIHQTSFQFGARHYSDVIMGAMASQFTSLTVVYPIVYSDKDQRKYQSSASLAFVWEIHRWPVNSPHKWPVTRKMFPFDDVIMRSPDCLLGTSDMDHGIRPLITKRNDVRSREVLKRRDYVHKWPYRLEFDRYLDSTAVETPVKFGSNRKMLRVRDLMRSYDKNTVRLDNKGQWADWV